MCQETFWLKNVFLKGLLALKMASKADIQGKHRKYLVIGGLHSPHSQDLTF